MMRVNMKKFPLQSSYPWSQGIWEECNQLILRSVAWWTPDPHRRDSKVLGLGDQWGTKICVLAALPSLTRSPCFKRTQQERWFVPLNKHFKRLAADICPLFFSSSRSYFRIRSTENSSSKRKAGKAKEKGIAAEWQDQDALSGGFCAKSRNRTVKENICQHKRGQWCQHWANPPLCELRTDFMRRAAGPIYGIMGVCFIHIATNGLHHLRRYQALLPHFHTLTDRRVFFSFISAAGTLVSLTEGYKGFSRP